MATTTLFAEILVLGALAEIWLVVALTAVIPPTDVEALAAIPCVAKDMMPILAIPVLAFTYALGWVMNFAAERAFKPLFQKTIRDRLFGGQPAQYDDARALILQKGSAELVRDFLFDRHIIRVARGNALNFTLLALAILCHWTTRNHHMLLLLSSASILFAMASFAQWLTRYRSQYKKVTNADKVLRAASRAAD